MVGFEMDENGVARQGYDVLTDGKVIGFVTTGYASPTLKKNIGLAIIDTNYSELNTPIEIQVRKRALKAHVISKRFYKKQYKK